MNYVLLTIGKTHTGKSTFAKELSTEVPNVVIIETDPIALFLKASFSTLHALDVDHKGSFSSPALKFLVFRTILDFALNQKTNIIMSNSNMYENGRRDVLKVIKNHDAKTIGLYFNYEEKIIMDRVKISNRDIDVLSVSKNFEELIINQRARFQSPNKDEFDYFFEVTHPEELLDVKKRIIEILK
ncbi:MAG: hypothetical protein JWN37_707 [Candidatus Nomurabacteria bacterium]|nr:hypothetical protein [Candidatus Nomurabacteria bacterium]